MIVQPPHVATTSRYHLTVAGHLDAAWADWFGGCTITTQPEGVTLVEVEVIDQAMLYPSF